MAQWREWLKALGSLRLGASLSAQVDDGRGWERAASGPPSEWLNAAEAYQDALEAWRKNPLAWRIIAITTDYVVGEGVTVSSSQGEVQAFIERFWNHPRNHLNLRLEAMCDELSRAGDLFVLLFRNPQDGLSYLRFVTKDRIRRIQTAENDWESERAYIELDGTQERRWLAPQDPQAQAQEAVMLHYAVNRPIGCLLGESDLAALIPWLQRYARLLEDRVRLNWAMRAFLWIVTVPNHRVAAKAEQYRVAPEAGSIIVKDESESWQPVTPNLHAFDASADLKAVRQMIDAGSHYPPHWRGEPQGINLATATAMQAPTEKHLQRRQRYFHFVIKDILIQAYLRAAEIGKVPYHPPEALQEWIAVSGVELSLKDNERLANAAVQLARAFNLLASTLPNLSSPSLRRAMLQQVLSFGGLSVSPSFVQRILEELEG
ncbi:MAG: hypothetical protein ACK44E_07170 [Anaerolineales bacterium]